MWATVRCGSARIDALEIIYRPWTLQFFLRVRIFFLTRLALSLESTFSTYPYSFPCSFIFLLCLYAPCTLYYISLVPAWAGPKQDTHVFLNCFYHNMWGWETISVYISWVWASRILTHTKWKKQLHRATTSGSNGMLSRTKQSWNPPQIEWNINACKLIKCYQSFEVRENI